MDYWAPYKQRRIVELLRETGIPSNARVLEFGSGVGVFAGAVKSGMPSLEVHGCDISRTGVEKARARHPQVCFHLLDDDGAEPPLGHFDLIYSHHVLEHVQDLDGALARISALVRPGGLALHVVPCGNPGSLEHLAASLVRHGISQGPDGLFYFDDISHVRRLTSATLEQAARRHGFTLRRALFANQFWGDIEYLSAQEYWGVFDWLNPSRGKDSMSCLKLLALLAVFAPLSVIRLAPGQVLRGLRTPKPAWKKTLFFAAAPLAALAYPFSWCVDALVQWGREWEWRHHAAAPNGGEMYLLFVKN